MALSLGVGVMDGFGLAMFLPLLQMVDHAKHDPKAMGNVKYLILAFNYLGIQMTLLNVLLIISGFFVLKGIALYINNIYDVNLRQHFIKEIRVSLTEDFSELSYKSFVLSDSGRIQNTLSGEVDRLALAYQNYFGAFQQFALVLIYICFAFILDAKFALLITLGGTFSNFLYRKIYVNTKKASAKLTAGANEYQGLIIQCVANFKYLKASGSLKKFNHKLLGSIFNIQDHNQRIGYLNAIIIATKEPLNIGVVCLVIYIQVTVMGGALGSILISLLFFYRALTALVIMQTFYNVYLSVSGSLDNMTDFQKELRQNREKDGSVMINAFNNAIEIKNADFSYPGRQILSDISLRITKNETVAFVGESGSGKTTLVNLLVGLMPIDEGDIFVDGINMSVLNKASFQNRVGYITQEPVIFNDTIFNNVTFWDEPTEQNIARFNTSLKKASIDFYVNSLPNKSNEVLGNSGINLSGGQKQRISIARELYKDIDILVLDEATSALDSETEKAIQQNIDSLKGEYTILIVAHRLSTIKNADKIILLDNGSIKQSGTFSQLYDKSERFKRMVSLQEV